MMSVVLEKLTKHICKIMINRPAARNAINYETLQTLNASIARFEEDSELRFAIIAGAGGTFCSGYDLNEIIHVSTGMPNLTNIERLLLPLGPSLSNKITIASIDGFAAGFGFELALKCDFRVSDTDAKMGFLNRRFGMPILNGGTLVLPDLIGGSRALDMVATGRAMLANEAHQSGLILHVSEVGCSNGKALNLARSLDKFDPLSLLNDLRSAKKQAVSTNLHSYRKERENGLQLLRECGPMTVASKFLSGKLARHGKFDLGNLLKPECKVTL